jgi:molybdate transport system substrate-binding protein
MLRNLFHVLGLLPLFLASAVLAAPAKPMLLYCGITMVRPMTEIAQAFEKAEGVKINISQGGSEDLYQSARISGVGDWYLPGEASYREKHLKEGLLGDYVTVGYNQMSLVVQKGNPKQVKADPRELLRKDVIAIIGSAESGSVGKEAKDILDKLGIYPNVLKAAAFLAPDSRSLMLAMRKGEADVTLTWRATNFSEENKAKLDIIDLDPKLAKPQALQLSLLKSSGDPALARRFMNFAASEPGQAIFRKHGFLDDKAAAAH